jgi:hypothetical protein
VVYEADLLQAISASLTALAAGLPGSANIIGKVGIDQTTPGTTNFVESVPNARRDTGVLHRNAIAAIDKVADYTAGNFTVANVAGVQGSLAFNTTYNLTGVPGNRWGPTAITAAIDAVLVTSDAVNTHVVDCTMAQATGAEWYDLFLSVDAAPKWVGRITEAQRAAGGFEILTLGTVTVNAGVAADHVYIGVVGTGIQTTNTLFAANNAYRPDAVGITSINCAGKSKAFVLVKLVVTDLRSAPSCTIVPFWGNQVSATDWHAGMAEPLNLLTQAGYPLEQAFVLDVAGATALRILVGSIAGQGAAASVWVELA